MIKEIKKVVVAGGGLMGSQISQIFPRYGIEITLYSKYKEDFDRADSIIKERQQTLIENGVVTKEQSKSIHEAIQHTTELDCFQNADLVIETIPEELELKKTFFETICKILPHKAIITTNTSAISINQLSKFVKGKERFLGMHWLNPPHIIPLVELIKGDETDQKIIEIMKSFLIFLQKEPVVLKKDVKGFVSNRLQFALLREASYLVERGVATPEDIDRAIKYGNGLRYMCSGPFKIVDFGGIEVFNNVSKYLYPDLSDEKDKNNLLEGMVAKGYNGVSTGQGFYKYSDEDKTLEENTRDEILLKVLGM